MFDALIASSVLVAASEVGDKTQLLCFVLAARLRQPLAIIGGIFVATLLNHALAAELGRLIAGLLTPAVVKWGSGLLFIGFGLWALKPDEFDTEVKLGPAGAFVTTASTFFIAEMGDKTQLATLTLGAHFESLFQVVAGTTLGMMAVDIPAVLIGARLAERLPVRQARHVAAALFIAVGIWTLSG